MLQLGDIGKIRCSGKRKIDYHHHKLICMKNIYTLLCCVSLYMVQAQIQPLTEVVPGTGYSNFRNLMKFQNKAFVFASTGSSSTAPWRLYNSDGTVAGTEVVYESDSIAIKNESRVYAVSNGKLYFITQKDFLWVTDGTTNGTFSLGQIVRNDTVQWLDDVAACGDSLVFMKLANKGLARINSITNTIDTFFNPQANCGIVFSRDGRAFTNMDPYGNSAETGVYDLLQSKFLLTRSVDSFSVRQYPLSNVHLFLQFLNNQEFIAVSQGSSSPKINLRMYKYNLTTDTKTLLGEIPENSNFSNNNMVTAGGKVFFGISKADSTGAFQKRGRIYVTDGTVAGTDTITITGKYTYSHSMQETAFGNGVLFAIDGSMAQSDRAELWFTDGTQNGTVKVYQYPDTLTGIGLNYTYASEGRSASDTFNGSLYFILKQDIWRTDGTAQGTEVFCDWNTLGYTSNILNVGGKLFFDARSKVCVGNELWVAESNNVCTTNLSCPSGIGTENMQQLRVYPNPAHHRLQIELMNADETYFLKLMSADGSTVYSDHPIRSSAYTLPTGHLPGGVYYLQLQSSSGYYTGKVVVQH